MITKTIELYEFHELDESAKEQARQWFRSRPDEYWHEEVYYDAVLMAKILGIAISEYPIKTLGGGTRYLPSIYFNGFSYQGDGACFEGSYSYAKKSCKLIRAAAPQDATLHRIADNLRDIQARNGYSVMATVKHSGHYYHSRCTDIDVDGVSDANSGDYEDVPELLRDFMDWIFGRLRDEYDSVTSDEYIDDAIEANGYTFLSDGTREDS